MNTVSTAAEEKSGFFPAEGGHSVLGFIGMGPVDTKRICVLDC